MIKIYVFSIIFLSSIVTYGQKVPSDFGILIALDSFERTIIKLDRIMSENRDPSVDECIEMVRVSNTINFDNMKKKSFYEHFDTTFQNRYMKIVRYTLGMNLGKGMSWYSVQYDLYIGGEVHANSKFRLTDNLR